MFNWLKGMFRAHYYKGVPLRDPALVDLFGVSDASAGVNVDETTALNISAFFAGVRLISQCIGSLPVAAYEKKPDGSEVEVFQYPLLDVLNVSPNHEMTAIDVHETSQAHCLTWGNSYAEIVRAGEQIGSLWPLTPDRVTPDRDEHGEIIYKVDEEGEEPRTLRAEEVLHFHGLGYDGVQGYSVVQLARETLGLALATEKYGAGFYGQSSIPGGVIEHPGDLGPEAETNLRKSWERLHRGSANAHRVAILDEQMKYHPVTLPAADAQYLATRKFQVVEIARWLDIPPHMLRDLEQATFNNIEHMSLEFLNYSLRPWLTRREQRMQMSLVPKQDQKRIVLRYVADPLILIDTLSRFNAYQTATRGGWYSLNDVRKRERLPRLVHPDADNVLVPLDHAMLGEKKPEPQKELLNFDLLNNTLNFIKNNRPFPWDVAALLIAEAIPDAKPDHSLVQGLVAKLASELGVIGKPDDGVNPL